MEIMEEQTNDSFKWTHDLTKAFIYLMEVYYAELTSTVKKNVFKKIAGEINKNWNINLTWDQCDNKWKGLVRQYKKTKLHNETSGNNIKHWTYYDSVGDIIKDSPEITAVALFSSNSEVIETADPKVHDEVNVIQSSNYTTKVLDRSNRKRKSSGEAQLNINHYRSQKLELMGRYTTAIEKIAEQMTAGRPN